MKVRIRNTQDFSLPDGLERSSRRRVVWWYGPLRKNFRASSVPNAIVFFRDLNENNELGEIKSAAIALTHLGILRLGSIWKNGTSCTSLDLKEETFKVSFDPSDYSITSPYEAMEVRRMTNPISPQDYTLLYHADKNQLLDFPLTRGRNLLIPCIEYFVRCYGRSTEVKRVLATYSWENACPRLFGKVDKPQREGVWSIKLAQRLRPSDAVFLAHVWHDKFAQRQARKVYAQLNAQNSPNRRLTFLKIAPWFRGPAEIRVAGLIINDGKTFLGLRITGASNPIGPTIYCESENEPSTMNSGANDAIAGPSWRGWTQKPDNLDLTDDDEPDNASGMAEIEEEKFMILGEKRPVYFGSSPNNNHGGTVPVVGTAQVTSYSTGERFGADRGVGYASIHARPVMESQGILREMWNAALALNKFYPELILEVSWFTFEHGFSSGEPQLIALEPFANETSSAGAQIPLDVKNWVFFDVQNQIPRGVLVIKIKTPGTVIYIAEIQRRPYNRTLLEEKIEDRAQSGETYKGMVFTLEKQEDFQIWLKIFLNHVRHRKGIVGKLVHACLGQASTFKHVPSSRQSLPLLPAILNALRKMGLKMEPPFT
jgi:hypothetical protein